MNNAERYKKIDDEHIIDNQTGVELHVYDDWFKLTHDGDIIARMSDFSNQEQEVVWKIKQAITDPDTAIAREHEYPNILKGRRENLSNLFENPKPVKNISPVMEENTVEYLG